MITFRHGATNFSNLVFECSGEATKTISVVAGVLMETAKRAIKTSNPKRLHIDGNKIRCEYNQQTAYITHTIICGFECLAEISPDEVKVERISSRKMTKDEAG